MIPTTGFDGKRKAIIVCSALADGDRNERPDTLDNADLCLCSSCPTRTECMRQQEQRSALTEKQTATLRVKGVSAADVCSKTNTSFLDSISAKEVQSDRYRVMHVTASNKARTARVSVSECCTVPCSVWQLRR
jgi:hypothetical protein